MFICYMFIIHIAMFAPTNSHICYRYMSLADDRIERIQNTAHHYTEEEQQVIS